MKNKKLSKKHYDNVYDKMENYHKKFFREKYKSIYDKFEQWKGTFVITESNKIRRLISVIDSYGDFPDYYWVYYDGRDVVFDSCVGGFIPLKGKINEKDYERLIRMAKLNHHDQSTLFGSKETEEIKKFNDEHKKEVESELNSKKLKHRAVTETCWELK